VQKSGFICFVDVFYHYVLFIVTTAMLNDWQGQWI